tara:strand:+ start:314 stop:1651 length:1338 start_codon:yes stop_codon:yes gene_type:complete
MWWTVQPPQKEIHTVSYIRTLNTTYEEVKLSQLKTHPSNPRRGDLEAIKQSISINGFYGSVVVNRRTSHILAGNHRYLAAKDLGYESVPVTWVDVGEREEKRILAADNRTSELGGYDDAILTDLLQELSDADMLEGSGYGTDELEEMIDGLSQESTPREVCDLNYDKSKELVEKWEVKEGQVWRVGRHRLMCGSCLDETHLDMLLAGEKPSMVYADPPYGISIVATNPFVGGGEAYNIPFGGKKAGTVGASKPFGSKGKTGTVGASNIIKVNKYAEIAGDDDVSVAIDAFTLMFERYPSSQCTHVWWGGNYYADHLPASSCWIVWDKENTGNFADAELAWCSDRSAVRIFRHMWNGMLKASERGERRIHPTQKPIALAEWCFDKYLKSEGQVILDPFLGSGPSVIASERLGHSCYGMELSSEYIALNLERLSEMGLTPELVEEVS